MKALNQASRGILSIIPATLFKTFLQSVDINWANWSHFKIKKSKHTLRLVINKNIHRN